MIYAINAIPSEWREEILKSLKEGEGRFGWSLHSKQNLLTDDYDEEKSKCSFLKDLQDSDYVVYINMPEYGECTLAKVKSGYYWKEPMDEDFNHCFRVYPESIKTFDRNSALVSPYLSTRLKLQNRYWRIYCEDDFNKLLNDLAKIPENEQPVKRTIQDNFDDFTKSIADELSIITEKLYENNPNFHLEKFMQVIFERTGKFQVENKHGSGDKGADLILTYTDEFGIPELDSQRRCLVQIKSYTGEISNLDAVDDLKNAFIAYSYADSGLIITTAASVSDEFIRKLDELRQDVKRPIGLLYGEELAKFIMKYL